MGAEGANEHLAGVQAGLQQVEQYMGEADEAFSSAYKKVLEVACYFRDEIPTAFWAGMQDGFGQAIDDYDEKVVPNYKVAASCIENSGIAGLYKGTEARPDLLIETINDSGVEFEQLTDALGDVNALHANALRDLVSRLEKTENSTDRVLGGVGVLVLETGPVAAAITAVQAAQTALSEYCKDQA